MQESVAQKKFSCYLGSMSALIQNTDRNVIAEGYSSYVCSTCCGAGLSLNLGDFPGNAAVNAVLYDLGMRTRLWVLVQCLSVFHCKVLTSHVNDTIAEAAGRLRLALDVFCIYIPHRASISGMIFREIVGNGGFNASVLGQQFRITKDKAVSDSHLWTVSHRTCP